MGTQACSVILRDDEKGSDTGGGGPNVGYSVMVATISSISCLLLLSPPKCVREDGSILIIGRRRREEGLDRNRLGDGGDSDSVSKTD